MTISPEAREEAPLEPHKIIAEELWKIGWIGRGDAQSEKLKKWWSEKQSRLDSYEQGLREERNSLRADLARVTEERERFQSELQKVCDHDWEHVDDSFDHEFGTEQIHSSVCTKCGAEKPYEPETFGDEAI